MNIIWDSEKNEWLILHRNISFQDICEMILKGEYIDIIENPSRDNQMYFILEIESYIWVIPFILDAENNIVLKTAFPSRKYTKKYRGEK